MVADETKVVEYGVIDMSRPMQGEFILFSKWIPYWLILVYVWVKDNRYV